MPARRPPSSDLLEARLLTGTRGTQRLVQQSATLMRSRVSLHAETVFGKNGTPENDRRQFLNLYKVTEPRAIFRRCRELSKLGFIEWVLRAKKLLLNHGLEIEGIEDAGLKAELQRVIKDIVTEVLICNAAVAIWKADDAGMPTVQILDSEGVKYEDDFGEQTLIICYKSRSLSDAQQKKLGKRYADALSQGAEIEWGEEAGEAFAVLKGAKLGQGLGTPSLWGIFEELAIHGLLTKGDWNAAWTAKDVIRQFSKGHDIKSGNMAGLPVHFLKATERDAIHKAVADKTGAFDIVTNFDIDVKYPQFDFKFFDDDKYKATRQRLMEWAGPVGALYLNQHGSSKDDDTMLTLLRMEVEAMRADIAALVATIAQDENFRSIKSAKLKWNPALLLSWQALTNFVSTMVGGGVMSTITGRKLTGLDEATENKNMATQREKPENYMPVFEAHQAMLNPNNAPTAGGGRPPSTGKLPVEPAN